MQRCVRKSLVKKYRFPLLRFKSNSDVYSVQHIVQKPKQVRSVQWSG